MSAAVSNTSTNDLCGSDEIRRRQWILNSIPLMTKSQAQNLWKNTLTDVEKETPDIVYKLLQYNYVHDVFCPNPWSSRSYFDEAIDDLPTKFINDAQAFIAFTKQDDFAKRHEERTTFDIRSTLNLPVQFKDNFDVMKAVCLISPFALANASDRLKDDEDLVFTALFNSTCLSGEMKLLLHASNRLQKSKEFIRKCFLEISARCHQRDYKTEDFAWISRYCSGFPADTRGIGFDRSNDHGKRFSIQDMSEFLRILPPKEAADAAKFYPREFFNNEDAIMELVNRLGRHAIGDLYSYKHYYFERSSALQMVRALVDTEMLKQIDEKYKKVEQVFEEDIIKQISSKEITSFDDMPEKWRLNQNVLSKTVECGWFDAGLESVLSFTAAVKASASIKESADHKKRFWETRNRIYGGKLSLFELWFEPYSEEGSKLYSILPEQLQMDEEVAIALLESGCDEIDLMLENIPSLYKSKRALNLMLYISDHAKSRCCFGDPAADYFIEQSPFRADKELMILACNLNDMNLELVDKTLFEDRDFVERVIHPQTITESSEEFQMGNLDLVETAIKNPYIDQGSCYIDQGSWGEDISPKVWTIRSIVMTWLAKAESSYYGLEMIYNIDKANPFLNDKEVVSLSVNARPSDLQYAHTGLRSDTSFILKCVREAERILQYAPKGMCRDDGIAIAAISQDDGNIVDCFNILNSKVDEEYLSTLLHRVKSKLKLHDMFIKVFLMGASRDDQHTIHPSLRSPLPMLNQGAETSIKLKKMIAEYAGVPIGQSYIEMKGTVAALERFRF